MVPGDDRRFRFGGLFHVVDGVKAVCGCPNPRNCIAVRAVYLVGLDQICPDCRAKLEDNGDRFDSPNWPTLRRGTDAALQPTWASFSEQVA